MDRSSSMSNSLSQIFLGVTQNFDLWPHQHGQEHNPARILPHGPMVTGSENRPVWTVPSELGHRIWIRNDARYAPTSLFQLTWSQLTNPR